MGRNDLKKQEEDFKYTSMVTFLAKNDKMEYLKKSAIIEGNYRYSLMRQWDNTKRFVLWIMLNPSTADAYNDDNTIREIVKISKHNGYGGLYVCNVYAYRTKKPSELFKNRKIDYTGEYNSVYIRTSLRNCASVVLACGRSVKHDDFKKLYNKLEFYKSQAVCQIFCLGYNKDGTPVHPLYQRDDSIFIEYDIRRI